jgi:heptosyltransferase-2
VFNARSLRLLHSFDVDTSLRKKRILLVRTDRLGDVVLTLPMLPLLRKRFPDARIEMLLASYTAELVAGHPSLDDILLYDGPGGMVPFMTMLREIRAKSYDTAIIVRPTARLAMLMSCAGIPARIGTGYRYYSLLFNRRVYEHRKHARRHELEYNLALLKELDCPADGDPEFCISVPGEVEKRIDVMLHQLGIDTGRPLVVIHPGTGGSAREWPPAYFGSLSARLLDKCAAQVLVTGARGEERKVAEVILGTQGRGIPLVGLLTLKELAALIKRAHLFVSNSTGPLHIAVAMGTPVIGLFPQTTVMSPARWGPYTTNKKVFVPDKPLDCVDCRGMKDLPCACMMSIPVEEVFKASSSLLAREDRGVASHG